MANTVQDENEQEPALKIDTSRALQSVGYNSIIAAENGPSSEEEAPEAPEIPEDDARTAIGVSISREQTRLTSPQTPSVEKAAAMESAGGFWANFDRTAETLFEEPEEDFEEEQDEPEHRSGAGADTEEERPSTSTTLRLETESIEHSSPWTEVEWPSPWRVEQNPQWQTNERPRSGLLDGIFNRRRAYSGPDPTTAGKPRSLLSSLPSLTSMPKHFSISSYISGSRDTTQSRESDTKKWSSTPSTPRMQGSTREVVPQKSEIDSEDSRRLSVQTGHSKTGLLRRSTSDHSLTTQRTLSRTITLGDDGRFEDVHDQVNSRFKAIKDSWQDTNIKISSLSNIKVPNFAPDFLRERAGSLNKRQSVRKIPVETTTSIPAKQVRPIDPMTRQPHSSAKALSDAQSGKLSAHPHFNHALEQLEGDVVILGGYRGSILRSAEPPHRQVWVPIKVGLNIRKVYLEVGFEEGDDERATDFIIPDGMLTHIGPVDISRRLFKRLRACENARSGKLTVRDYGYDWRLAPHHLSNQLIRYLETLPCNQSGVSSVKRGATVIAHSLGGLITRHAVNQRPELFKGVVYAGVPQTCVNILGPLRNGDEVLLSERVLTAQVNFSIRTSYALLPLDGRCFFDINTKEQYPVDFFDAKTWIDLRLSPCVNQPLSPLQAPPKPTGITGYVTSMASVLPGLPLRGRKDSGKLNDSSKITTAGGVVGADMGTSENSDVDLNKSINDSDMSNSVRTAVTLPRDKAIEYLERTLASVKRFKQELAFNPKHSESNMYPPIAVIYGKSTPTVFGAKVDGREGIKYSDAYDNLAFASGDGVVLARAAMAPEGYKPARGGIVSSDRGHVTLLGDLEAVGK